MAIQVELLDTANKAQVEAFVRFPFKIYKDCPQWVPPILSDIRLMLSRNKHPFYEHSDADFFVAKRDGEIVGRIAVMENRPYNQYHGTQQAQFYLFETIEDLEVAQALFERAYEWARQRGLNEIVGPKGFSPFDGYGILGERFEHRQMMTMMNYNPPYYPQFMEALGFQKEVDFVSCYLHRTNFVLPEKVKEVAKRVQERGYFEVKSFETKSELRQWAKKIGKAYNETFINNWEYYPLTEREIDFVVDTLITVANPRLIKIILSKDKVVGFLFGFPDVSEALQRARGRLTPWAIVDLLLEMRRTKWVSLNGAGVLPEYHGRGGNALLYAEMQKTVLDFGFEHAELTQVAESAVQMRKDLITIGGKAYKNHRVYFRHI